MAPHLSRAAVQIHHAHHHRIFAHEFVASIAGTRFVGLPIETVIVKTVAQPAYAALFKAAAQTWSHDFYFRSMRPSGGGAPNGHLGALIERQFGGVEPFSRAFIRTAMDLEGSGWAWLVLDRGKLAITATANSDTPLAHGQTPLLALDLWEHAYHLDHQGRREDYVRAYLGALVNWQFANANLERALHDTVAAV